MNQMMCKQTSILIAAANERVKSQISDHDPCGTVSEPRGTPGAEHANHEMQ
jgi:hypothetical protein